MTARGCTDLVRAALSASDSAMSLSDVRASIAAAGGQWPRYAIHARLAYMVAVGKATQSVPGVLMPVKRYAPTELLGVDCRSGRPFDRRRATDAARSASRATPWDALLRDGSEA